MDNSTQSVEALIGVASRLISLLEREVELLRSMKTGAISGLQDEKNRLVKAYEEQVRAFAAAPEQLRTVAPALQAEFAEIAMRFEQVMADNHRALAAASEAQERFMKAIAAAAQEKRASFRGYSAGGAVSTTQPRKSPAPPVALTLDRRF